MDESPIEERHGVDWSIICDTTKAPIYILLTLRGVPSLSRTQEGLALLDAARPRITLSTGELCPIIVLSEDASPPSAEVLRSEYDLLDMIFAQISCLVCVLTPEHQADPKMQMVLDATGLRIAPHTYIVTSLEEAYEVVSRYHARHHTE